MKLLITGIVCVLAVRVASAQDSSIKRWRIDGQSMSQITLPDTKPLRELVANELEYSGKNPMPKGLIFDLNEDGRNDYVIQSVDSLCGTGGCIYALVDGQNNKELGMVFGSPIIVSNQKINGYPVIHAYGHSSAEQGSYACFVFDGKKYIAVSSVELEGESLKRLFEELNKLSTIRKQNR